MPELIVLHFFRIQFFLRMLVQVARAMVEVGSHQPQPPMPLRSGSELDAAHPEGKQPSRMQPALHVSELAHKRENCFRQGLSRGMRNRRKKAHGWHMILKSEFLQPGLSLDGWLEVDLLFFSQETVNHVSYLASQIT